jgi:DNA-directed RNA polymerase subunit M/transcription elongation factor TFIIS
MAPRPPEPHCPVCKEDMAQITLRTPMEIYYRCIACRQIWTELKPHKSKRAD